MNPREGKAAGLLEVPEFALGSLHPRGSREGARRTARVPESALSTPVLCPLPSSPWRSDEPAGPGTTIPDLCGWLSGTTRWASGGGKEKRGTMRGGPTDSQPWYSGGPLWTCGSLWLVLWLPLADYVQIQNPAAYFYVFICVSKVNFWWKNGWLSFLGPGMTAHSCRAGPRLLAGLGEQGWDREMVSPHTGAPSGRSPRLRGSKLHAAPRPGDMCSEARCGVQKGSV